mgnify:CR=1 FL=1
MDSFFEERFDVLQCSGSGTGTTAARTLVMDVDLFAFDGEDVDSTTIVCKGGSDSNVE